MGIFSWLASGGGSEGPGWLRRWVQPRGRGEDPELDQIRLAAAEDVAEVEQDRKCFRRDGPENQGDDL
ncbi:MAG TPA: hypothetical protein VHY58_16310 [Streptosporangiaceae bacterium]|jgi:hypothetical protein|nr:hypothetical protein [Streptosporangiaceae bacterium]